MRLCGSTIVKKTVYSYFVTKEQRNKRHILYSTGMAQQRSFRQRNCCWALANLELEMHFRVSSLMFNRVFRVQRNDLVET